MLLYVLLALSTGAFLAFNSTLNAALSKRIGVFPGTLVNYITGLLTTLLLTTLLGQWLPVSAKGLAPFLFTGGIFGVLVVAMTNVALPRVPVVYVTVILFTGQTLMGIVIDALNGTPVTWGKAAGCALIIAGLICNIMLDRSVGKTLPK